ncbi:MAG: hypothetical protein ABI411_17850 [Tahibacter sp.]
MGSATAETNVNINQFTVPNGYRIHFTGMRVTRHGGATPFHRIGVQPDVAVERRLAGERTGCDDVLERRCNACNCDALPPPPRASQ